MLRATSSNFAPPFAHILALQMKLTEALTNWTKFHQSKRDFQIQIHAHLQFGELDQPKFCTNSQQVLQLTKCRQNHQNTPKCFAPLKSVSTYDTAKIQGLPRAFQ